MPKRKAASEVSSEVPKRLKPASETREGKKVQRYTEAASEPKKTVEEIVVPKGKGTKLGEIENGTLL